MINEADYEIVGMNGSVLVACARSLTVGHKLNKDEYFLADDYFFTNGEPQRTYTLYRIKTFQNQNRLVLFQDPFPIFNDALALCVEKAHLEQYSFLSDSRPLNSFNGINLTWQELPNRTGTFVTCNQSSIINPLLKNLGRSPEFYESLREKLRKHFSEKSPI